MTDQLQFPVASGRDWSDKVVSAGGAEEGVDAYLANDGHSTYFVRILGWFIDFAQWMIGRLTDQLYATSTTPLTIETVAGAGSCTLTVQPDLAFGQGHYVTVTKTGDNTREIYGQVLTYDAGTGALAINPVIATKGTGAVTSWVVRGSAPRGEQGAPGLDGEDGADGVTPGAATESAAGIVELATDTEAQTGTDTSRAMTPANVTARLRSTVNMADATLRRPYLQDYAEVLVGGTAGTNTGSAATIDLENGNIHHLILSAACTFTFSNPPATGRGGNFTLILRNDGTPNRTITWPASVDWPGGSAPSRETAANAVNIYTFITYDAGTTWFGLMVGRGVA